MSSFVHLHLHSQYSLLDGANRLDDLMEAAKAADMPAMALTDHGNMFGAIDFYNRAHKAGIKPILGMEAYVAQGSRTDRTPARSSSNHLVLLARNEVGYRNLIKLTSDSYLEGFYYKPRVDLELLRQHSEGLICLSACLKGKVNQLILGNQVDRATATALEFREIFGEENFFLELQDHGIEDQKSANEVLRRIAKRTGIETVVEGPPMPGRPIPVIVPLVRDAVGPACTATPTGVRASPQRPHPVFVRERPTTSTVSPKIRSARDTSPAATLPQRRS